MGWNKGYEIMELKIIEVYNQGILTPGCLDKLMEPYKGTDCDSGGSCGLLSTDGLCAEHIICKVMEPDKTKEAENKPYFWYDFEEKKESYMAHPDPLWNANRKAYKLFQSIWRDRWHIW